MKNLIVIHTQYNLLLAVGLCQTNFINDENDLILFRDFNYTAQLARKIEPFFTKKLILEGNYPKYELSAVQKMRKIFRDNRMIKEFVLDIYDRVLIVDDACIQEMYTLKCCRKRNSQVDMAWLEDGSIASFSNGVISGGMGATPFRRAIRKMFFSTMFSLGGCYDLSDVMGGHQLLKKIYVTFPEYVRKELAQKEKVLISEKAFELGITTLFKDKPVVFEEGSFLIALDKLDVYGDKKEKVNALIQKEIEDISKQHKKIYYKYHPRETERLSALESCIELDRRVALESYLVNSITRNMTVVGIKSTSLQTAKKMSYKAVSLIKAVDDNGEEIIKFYTKIGIECRIIDG